MNDFSIELDANDYRKLMRIVDGLSELEKDKAINDAMKEGMKVIVEAGKTNYKASNRKVTGGLYKSFSISPNKKRKSVYGGFKRPSGAVAHLIDRGTKERYTKKGYYRGSISKGKPNTGSMFWTKAIKENADNAMEKVMQAIYDSVDKITSRN